MKNSEKTKKSFTSKEGKSNPETSSERRINLQEGKQKNQPQVQQEEQQEQEKNTPVSDLNKKSGNQKMPNGQENNKQSSTGKKTNDQNLHWKDPDPTKEEETRKSDPTEPEKNKEVYDDTEEDYARTMKAPGQQENQDSKTNKKQTDQTSKKNGTVTEDDEEDDEENEGENNPKPDKLNPEADKKEAFAGEKNNSQNMMSRDRNKKGL